MSKLYKLLKLQNNTVVFPHYSEVTMSEASNPFHCRIVQLNYHSGCGNAASRKRLSSVHTDAALCNHTPSDIILPSIYINMSINNSLSMNSCFSSIILVIYIAEKCNFPIDLD